MPLDSFDPIPRVSDPSDDEEFFEAFPAWRANWARYVRLGILAVTDHLADREDDEAA